MNGGSERRILAGADNHEVPNHRELHTPQGAPEFLAASLDSTVFIKPWNTKRYDSGVKEQDKIQGEALG